MYGSTQLTAYGMAKDMEKDSEQKAPGDNSKPKVLYCTSTPHEPKPKHMYCIQTYQRTYLGTRK